MLLESRTRLVLLFLYKRKAPKVLQLWGFCFEQPEKVYLNLINFLAVLIPSCPTIFTK